MDGDALYPDLLQRAVLLVDADLLDVVERVHAVNDLAKDRVLAVQMRRLGVRHVELRRVAVGPAVGHGHHAPRVVLAAKRKKKTGEKEEEELKATWKKKKKKKTGEKEKKEKKETKKKKKKNIPGDCRGTRRQTGRPRCCCRLCRCPWDHLSGT